MNRYKYFLIYDRNKHILYGECIKWQCGEFDSTKLSDVTINLKNKFKAQFITSENRVDHINESESLTILDEISFQYEDKYEDFITQRSDEIVFTPLIDRCSKITMFVGHEIPVRKFQPWVEKHKNLLEEIKSRFDLDLLKRPELINSYTYYEPTRIVVKCRFTDKPAQGEDRLPTNLKVNFYDEFNSYGQSNYIIIGYCDVGKTQRIEGKVSEKEVNIVFDESPDELEIKILNEETVIYNSRHEFLRKIQIQGKIIGGSVTLENGSRVSKYTKIDMNVGDK